MAKIYTALIQKGLKTIDDVPARIRTRKLKAKPLAAVSFSKTWLPPLRTSMVQSSHTGASSLPLLVTSTV